MAPLRFVTLAAPLLLLSYAVSVVHQNAPASDRTVTQVVKLLQGMLDQSQTDGNAERDLFAKYKCYCDTNEASKKAEIEKLTNLIGVLENKIEQLLASAGSLSRDLQRLKRDIAANQKAQDDATTLRGQERGEFEAKRDDLTQAIGQMHDAIEVLSEVGADQTLGDAAQDHTQFMANFSEGASLAGLKTTVRKALVAASALAGQKQTSTIEAFLQEPFTGAYAAQSGEVVGILKDMHDTFKANLEAEKAAEAKAIKAYNKFILNMGKAKSAMEKEYLEKQQALATNDDTLGAKRDQLQLAREDLDNAQTFLTSLLSMCDAKSKQYNERVALRSKEETALAEAISILNSDAAFATFGTVTATRSGDTSFVQLHAIRSHSASPLDGSRKKVQAFLQRTAETQHLPLLGRIVALLQTKNPFAVVLEEIDKMIELISAEERADDEQQQWCDQERGETDSSILTKTSEISELESTINTLNSDINDPQEGLLAQEAATEELIQENHNNQVSQTEQRRQDNEAYQKDVANLVSAEALLKRAIVVLRKYYSKVSSEIAGADLLQQTESPTEPAPPDTWDDKYVGQSSGAKTVVDMLDFILENTQAEKRTAHEDELSAQHSYEDAMQNFKSAMNDLQTSLGTIQATLARKRRELRTKEKEHSATSKEKAALESYLEKIKPGCDFITTNIDQRKANRVSETTALKNAKRLLKESPAFTEAVASAHQESLGECRAICNDVGEANVKCKACLAEVSVPGYCAGHPDTDGCSTTTTI